MSTAVAGVDFGTLSVRVSLVDNERGPIGSGTGEYALQVRVEIDFPEQLSVSGNLKQSPEGFASHE